MDELPNHTAQALRLAIIGFSWVAVVRKKKQTKHYKMMSEQRKSMN
jgi:hypothetical protein